MPVKNPSHSGATITIGDLKLPVFSTLAGISSVLDGNGMPAMGTMASTLEFSLDITDKTHAPFDSIKQLFDLCNQPTKDKVKDMKIEFWRDETKQDSILSLSFKGWVSSWTVSGGQDNNAILSITLQPRLESNQYIDIRLGN